MKKLLLLFLLVAGGVSTVSAANNAYLYGSFQGLWNENDTSYPFTKISDSEFRILINSDWVKDDAVYFRFKVDGRNQGVSSNQEVTTSEYGATDSEINAAFYINKITNATSKLVYIKIAYKNNGYGDKWQVSYYTRDAVNNVINFTKDNESWGSTINLYAWDSDGVQINGAWPGKGMTNTPETNNYSYTLKVPNDGTKNLIFNDGNGGHQYPTSGGLSSANKGNYNTSGFQSLEVQVTSAGYATLVSPYVLDFSSTAIKAYTAKVNTENGKVPLTKIDKVPANTPVVLYKAGGTTENIPLAASTDTPAESDLVAGTGLAVATGESSPYNYILNNVGGVIGFYKANNQIVATDRAYLQTTYWPGDGARMSIVFADETTGINNLTPALNDGAVYDLQGRRVAQPTKGLYIINGKKVIK